MKKKGKNLCEGKQQSMKIRIYEDFANIISTHTDDAKKRDGEREDQTKQQIDNSRNGSPLFWMTGPMD